MTKKPILECYNLRKDYETKAGVVSVLRGIDMAMGAGELSFVIGRSGSGKSTLLHLLGCLDRPSHGKILFEGEDVTRVKEKVLARIRNQRLGFVFQAYYLLPELTLLENVMLPSLIAGKPQKVWALEILKRARLLSRKNHYPSELSGGEQQRAAIARALVNRPSLLFCDEPTGNLDTETSESVFNLLFELNREEGQTTMIVTHDEAQAWRHANVYRLVDGALLKGDPTNVSMDPIDQNQRKLS